MKKRVSRLLQGRDAAVVDGVYERVEVRFGAVIDADKDHEPLIHADPGAVGRRFVEVL